MIRLPLDFIRSVCDGLTHSRLLDYSEQGLKLVLYLCCYKDHLELVDIETLERRVIWDRDYWYYDVFCHSDGFLYLCVIEEDVNTHSKSQVCINLNVFIGLNYIPRRSSRYLLHMPVGDNSMSCMDLLFKHIVPERDIDSLVIEDIEWWTVYNPNKTVFFHLYSKEIRWHGYILSGIFPEDFIPLCIEKGGKMELKGLVISKDEVKVFDLNKFAGSGIWMRDIEDILYDLGTLREVCNLHLSSMKDQEELDKFISSLDYLPTINSWGLDHKYSYLFDGDNEVRDYYLDSY